MKPARLITIPISHFCEKARWALERAGISYVEERHLQVFHYLAVKRAGGGISVPTLVTEDGTLGDSTDILHWVDAKAEEAETLYPKDAAKRAEVDSLEDLFDEKLGPATRRFVYGHLLPLREIAYRYNCPGIPSYQRAVLPFVYPLAAGIIRRRTGLATRQASEDAALIDGLFDDVAKRLSDGRRFLCGERFTAADLTFASLAAPVVVPSNYGVPLPPLEEVPRAMAEAVERWRKMPAGAFALRLYAEERGPFTRREPQAAAQAR